MNLPKTYSINTAIFLKFAVFFALISCEEKLMRADVEKKVNFPDRVVTNAHIIRKDSGRVNLNLKAPLIEEYSLIDSPYVEARKGIYMEYFDKENPKIPGKIWAKYAKMNKLRDFYIAKGNVKIITNQQQTFATQTLYWDKQKGKMYTTDTVYVTDKDGSTLVGANGMVAKDDFSEYTFNNNTGTFPSQGIPSMSK